MLKMLSFLGLTAIALMLIGPGSDLSLGNEQNIFADVNQSSKMERLVDQKKDAVSSYEELTRLLVALATGTLVLAPTVLSARKGPGVRMPWGLRSATILLIVSTGAGILVLSALTGTKYHGKYDIASSLVVWLSRAQWITFALGLVAFCIFTLANLDGGEEGKGKTVSLVIDAHQRLGQMSEQAGDLESAKGHYNEVIRLHGEIERG